MKTYRFYKNEIGWFIDLKYWPFSVGYLAMVAGADVLLDKLAGEKTEVTLKVGTKYKTDEDYDVLLRIQKLGLLSGAVYQPDKNKISSDLFDGANLLWLCPVTLFVFLRYPKRIYFKVV